jgi:hypothetical protein
MVYDLRSRACANNMLPRFTSLAAADLARAAHNEVPRETARPNGLRGSCDEGEPTHVPLFEKLTSDRAARR